jgi:HEAT repeat protein
MKIPLASGVALWLALGGITASSAREEPPEKRAALRYDGKSFEQWRDYLLTELKPERRIEGLEAMRCFATKGYAREAAQVVMQLAKEFGARDGLEQKEVEVLTKAGEVLVKMGLAAVPPVAEALDDSGGEACREWAENLLRWWLYQGSERDLARSEVKGLVRAVCARDAERRRSAVLLLGLTPSAEVDSIMREALGNRAQRERFVSGLLAVLEEKEGRVNRRSEVRHAAIEVLTNSGMHPKAGLVLPVLTAALAHPDSELRAAAARSLALMGPSAKPATPALLRAVKDTEIPVRLWAAVALDRIRGENRTAGPVLIEIAKGLQQEEQSDKWCKLWSFLGTPRAQAAVPALLQAFRELPAERVSIARTFRDLGPAASEALPILTEALQNPDTGARQAAAQAIESIRPTPAQ